MKYAVKSIWFLLGLLVVSCNEGIDPITAVDAGVDETAPQVTITYPTEGVELMPFEEETSITIKFEVKDDIEVSNVKVSMDGSQIASFSSFKDYRIVLEEVTYNGLGNGDHKVTVSATDLEGKTTTQEVNFAKLAPYSPQFDGEVFYMPFNGDYMDFISFEEAGEVGNPSFAGGGFLGADAYMGATDSYLTFPMDNLKSTEFSAAFWYKVNPTPDRAGILVVGDDETDRFQGFRLFREGDATSQRIKLNVGTGAGESWNDGGVIDVAAGEWVHVAISISQTQSTIYFNGVEMLTSTLSAPIDWTGCEELVIGSGGPTFSYWDHGYDASELDELRIFNKALTQSDVQIMINAANPYVPQYDGESLYMPFDGDYIDLIGSKAASQVGTPGFTDDSQIGDQAYMGALDSYINYPADGLMTPEFSGTFWYKVDANPDRAGIITIGDDEVDRFQGFRLFREGDATSQRIKLNVGTGAGESWNDGGLIDVAAGEWVHVAFTIASDKSTMYFNGAEVLSSAMSAPIDWTGCDTFTIGSGGPTFSYWGHLSDYSAMDDLRFFSKALSASEVAEIYGGQVTPKNFGSTLYLPFDGTNTDANNNLAPTVVGTPGFAGESQVGSDAYAGATDSYLTFPIDGLFSNQFSGAFWYKVDADPDRAGILTVSPPMNGTDNDLTAGFRLFREGDAASQRIKLHVGSDGGDVWNDGDVIDVTAGEWVHIAFTVTDTATQIYFNGEPVANMGDMTGKTISWANCTILSVGSGAPNFIGWNHLSDLSYIDDLYLFDRALTQEEIQEIMNK
ncbi:LamG-like jellyroll fold domain-containing protein [Flagellimonas pelagia]|uniref:LamG domain-containing protein n=1 Tax=Flagellimonas pelagia TaxID=2306998 RepID=A0A3A1NCV1_9FLAO|nr:LamG-like jellyroll fold domain-containing protein [Allomuricauda maritima]RIV42238.1 LamG domain-containing protein [Allomuricauda maritima]TXJ91128.1 LamG domain-containing protein [Allomuricauda maritima]